MKYPLIAIMLALFLSGCSSTWEGVKNDSSDIWNDTKETIHDATE